MSRKRMLAYFVSFVLLVVSIIVIYLLWNIGKAKIKCDLENLNGEILKYPEYNDSDIDINEKTKKKKEKNGEEQIIIVTIYKYNDYIITYNNDLDDNQLSYMTIKNSDNKVLYPKNFMEEKVGQKIVLKVTGVECTNDGSYIEKDVMNIEPKILDGKLYFVSISDSCYTIKNTKTPYYDYNYIDLNDPSLTVHLIQQMKLKSDSNYNNLCY